MQDFLTIMKQRGFVHQCTDEAGLSEYLKTAGAVGYIGFDCTAPSLHVGSLLQIMLLRWWQKCGHKPIVLMGGGTTKIGDPSGKDESRKVLTEEDIAANMAGIKTVFSQFLTFGEGNTDATMVNNDDWLKHINYISFLRDYGRHFSVNRMMSMDSVKLRLERDQHLSFLEFNYMILQAYDFVELNKTYGCRVQMGGSDQWGNIVMGVRLCNSIHQSAHGIPVHVSVNDEKPTTNEKVISELRDYSPFGITSPLITTSSGAKMGKTAAGAVWLNADLCSPYDYWQFWRNTEDADVEKFLKLFTELSLEEIASIKSGNINDAKKILATEATALLHGRDEALKAEATARAIFEQGGISENLPEISVSAEELAAGTPVYLLLVKAGFAASNGEARRLLKGGGAKLNDEAVAEDAKITQADFAQTETLKLSAGKKRHALVRRAG
jgi:tyrosyl-tRNA synthetase